MKTNTSTCYINGDLKLHRNGVLHSVRGSAARGSSIEEFYRGSNVLVTGGTGFMGKVLVQKLLRSCPHLSNIYLLVRGKKGKDVQARVHDLFQDPLFERLNKECPDFRHKIVTLEGDCSLPGLGLSPDDRQRIVKEVNIVFHMAATVRFDEKLEIAVTTNVKGTRELLLMCRDCSSLKVVVHVSTAYSHCYRRDIAEELYDPPITADKAIQLVECLDHEKLASFTNALLGDWPNTYTFTKAIAEDAVKTYGKGLPIGVFRPSIVVCTRADPVPGWIDNLYGPTGAVVGVGVGLIRTMHIKGSTVADIVPCDMAVNALIASAWDISLHQRQSDEVPVYNYVSSNDNPISWSDYINKNIRLSWQVPFQSAVWMITLTQVRLRFVYSICALFMHVLPALLIDGVLLSTGSKPKMLKTYQKLHKFTDVIAYFCTRQWKFVNDNVKQLWRNMDDHDRVTFDFDISNIKWEEHFIDSLLGVRTFLLKEDPNKLPQAINKRYKLYCAHQLLKCMLLCLVLWIFWYFLKPYVNLTETTMRSTWAPLAKSLCPDHRPPLE